MQKNFMDVFGKIDRGGDTEALFKDVVIERMVTNKSHDAIRLYLVFPTLIPRRRIKKLEETISNSYFGGNVRVIIIEKFKLSKNFSPNSVYDSYKDSIYDEISDISTVLLSLFKRAKIDFDSNEHLTVSLEDTVIAHEKEDELHDILDSIFCERCGQKLIIDFTYKPAEDSKYRKNAAITAQNKIFDITDRLDKLREDNSGSQMMIQDEPKKSSKEEADKKGDKKQKAAPKKQEVPQKTYRRPKQSDNPNMLYGRDSSGDIVQIAEIVDEIGDVTIHGKIIDQEARELRNEKVLFTMSVFDGSDTINAKMFLKAEEAGEVTEKLPNGMFVKIKGVASYDRFTRDICIMSIRGIEKIPDFTTKRMDNSPVKRVELHCHTKMSDMDGVSEVADIIAQAKAWGHKSIAITDHGVVQAFPDADHNVKPDEDFKVIYGCEVYLVDDTKTICANVRGQSLETGSFVIFDLETTGLNAREVDIIEIGAVKFENGQITDRFSEFVNPGKPIPYRITEITSITDAMVADAGDITQILPAFREFCGDSVLVAHNADFDTGCIRAWCDKLSIDWEFTYMDTIPMAKFFVPQLGKYGLANVAKHLNVPLAQHHRAVYDAECTAYIFAKLVEMSIDRGITTLEDLNEKGGLGDESIKKERPHHCIILAKNDLGRINLYRLISFSHLKYMRKVRNSTKPNMPKSLIEKYREGLIIGSACSEGELYQAILTGKTDQEISRIAEFYDYLEIQPTGNNQYLLKDDKYGTDTVEDLQKINKRIVKLGEEMNKPVCATCDVHFLNPEDELYRRIIMAGEGFNDADEQPPIFLHTTEEMLEEFSYLGSEKAMEVVVDNPGLISDMCEKIHPTRPDKCPPVIADSDTELRNICYNKAHEIYGEDLPEIVTERLERELNSIIGNGYAVMYIIAQKLVWKSNEDGYLVGSRGSVGSSFAATMAGITEVNPLQAHYICPECHYVDFEWPEANGFSGRAGCDMPDANCPKCGHPMIKEGFDIPFETFLGFKGNKEPDIDLNFSGDYQNKAHRYTEVIFGEGQTFRAGTITGVAENTAFGLVKKYYETHNEHKRMCEINRILAGCTGVRKSTGQHPGGIIVLPVGEDIYSFTPIQNPPKDETIITTHFDYHSIDSNLLKLDILGHDDPTMIRMMEDLTGESAGDIPLDDKEVMSLFMNTDALKLKDGQKLWGNHTLGTLGIPEFGTDNAMSMLRDAKPKEFSDLVRISGLSHGTDVWHGNAKDLIDAGIATISTCICTRDDIMTYLIGMGLDSEESFKIMEAVRKGIVAKGKCGDWDTWKQDMIDHEVPDWYISSCEKIKYMFPKAHAAAYVMMAWRIAYWKINKPLAYYAAYLSIRATAFNYEKMCQGVERCNLELERIKSLIDEKKANKESVTAKEKDLYSDLRTVQEFYLRGFEFLPINIYESDSKYFKIVDGKLLPPLSTIDGMGDTAAISLALAAKEKPFSSRDDIKSRGKVTSTVIETMDRLNLLGDLPQSDQLSIFDLMKGA